MKRISIVFAVLLLFCAPVTHAQLGQLKNAAGKVAAKGDEMAASKREKKIDKSPAATEIRAVEASIAKLDGYFGEDGYDEAYFVKNETNYNKFETAYQSLQTDLASLKKKDPSWDTEDYQSKEKVYTEKYGRIKTEYATINRKNELSKSLERVSLRMPSDMQRYGYNYSCEKLFKELGQFYDTKCPCGSYFREFYTEKLNIAQIQKDIAELESLDPSAVENSERIRTLKDQLGNGAAKLKQGIYDEVADVVSQIKATPAEKEFEKLGVLNYEQVRVETMVAIGGQADARGKELLSDIAAARKAVTDARAERNKLTPGRAGKLFFTGSDLSRDAFNDGAVIQKVDLGAAIYFRAFFSQPAIDYYQALPGVEATSYEHREPVLHYVFSLNGQEVLTIKSRFFEDAPDLYKNGLSVRQQMEPGEYLYNELNMKLLEVAKQGNNQLKLDLYLATAGEKAVVTADPIASGEITLVMGAAQKAKLLANSDFCLPKAGMSNGTIQSQAIAAFKEKGWKEQPEKAIILDKDWTVNRNKYTAIITSRFLNIVIVSKIDGKCIKQEFSFYQDHQGANKYGPLYLSGVGDQDDISCECLK